MTRLGIITNVTVEAEAGAVMVDVSLGPRNSKTAQFRQPANGIVVVPEEKDAVIVEEVGKNTYMASHAYEGRSTGLPTALDEGDIYIDTDSEIYIGDPGNAQPVADATHTHDVQLSDGTTATTDGPSSTTETNIE